MKKLHSFTLAILLSYSLLLIPKCSSDEDCVQGVKNEDCICIEIYEPVCGCNQKTYSNSCFAACDGITSYEPGECPQ